MRKMTGNRMKTENMRKAMIILKELIIPKSMQI